MMSRVKALHHVPAPTSITVGGKTFQVRIDDSQTVARGRDGCCDPLTESICICSHLPSAWKSSTYFHEIVEAVNTIWLAEALNHDDIDRLGEAIYQVFTDMGIEIDWA
jgi:hypothetical protein